MIDPPDSEPGPGPDDHDADLFDDDGAETIDCPACGAAIFADAERCPSCGHWISRGERLDRDDRRQRIWKWVAALLVVLLLIWLLLI